MTPLVIGPHGGRLGLGTPHEVPVQRTLLTTRSVEIPDGAPGVVFAGDPIDALAQVIGLLGKHRVWERLAAIAG